MKTLHAFAVAALIATMAWTTAAQEAKPVPKDSVRVIVPGCTKGQVFTAGPRAEDQPNRSDIPEGMHLRMNGPKKIIAEIKAHEGSMVEITGLMRRGQYGPDGVKVGGVRIAPGNGAMGTPGADQTMIDVEAWRLVVGTCRSR